MIRIKEFNSQYTHSCVQCGSEITYSKWGRAVCVICKAEQRLSSLDRKTDIPFHFILSAAVDFGRSLYHTRKTRPE